jgi:aminoglycoside phosphotransferase (APT) family kinase protein
MEVLPAGRMTSGIVRRGNRIWRPMGPWSPAVHEYLRHLEAAGFAGAPRVLGIEGDREVLTYLPGEVAADPAWQPGHGHRLPAYTRTGESLRAAARLLRQLHDAAAGFQPGPTGYRFHPYPPLPGEVVGHGDLGPWNTVYVGGLPVGFIDWDGAKPVVPLTDLAAAAWAFVPLAPAAQLTEAGFERPEEMAARLASFVTAYGLADPASVLPELVNCRLAWPPELVGIAPDAAGIADKLEHTAREIRWIDSVRPELARALAA